MRVNQFHGDNLTSTSNDKSKTFLFLQYIKSSDGGPQNKNSEANRHAQSRTGNRAVMCSPPRSWRGHFMNRRQIAFQVGLGVIQVGMRLFQERVHGPAGR